MAPPTNKCTGCNVMLKKRCLSCALCSQKYDLLCANITLDGWNNMSAEAKQLWNCYQCRSKIPKSDNTNTPIRPASSYTNEDTDIESYCEDMPAGDSELVQTTNSILYEGKLNEYFNKFLTIMELKLNSLKDIVSEIDKLRNEQQRELKELTSEQLKIKQKNEEIEKSVQFLSDKYDLSYQQEVTRNGG